MAVLRRLFGPSRDEIWRRLSAEVGGQFVQGSFTRGSKVSVSHGEWTVTLDNFVVSTGHSAAVYTRIRAPYVNHDGFRFTIYRKGRFSDLAKRLGMQDIEIGDASFDRDFIIKGTDAAQVRGLLANERVKRLIAAQPEMYLTVKDDEGWFGTAFPNGVDELYFAANGMITDLERLEALYDLFGETLDQLCRIGSAYEGDPRVAL
ncbi:MAG: DUF3137 domain-containing protein [Gemmatimonadaceae bacterium]